MLYPALYGKIKHLTLTVMCLIFSGGNWRIWTADPLLLRKKWDFLFIISISIRWEYLFQPQIQPITNQPASSKTNWLIINVIPIGFEPMTAFLEGRCSIQLSYGTKL